MRRPEEVVHAALRAYQEANLRTPDTLYDVVNRISQRRRLVLSNLIGMSKLSRDQ